MLYGDDEGLHALGSALEVVEIASNVTMVGS